MNKPAYIEAYKEMPDFMDRWFADIMAESIAPESHLVAVKALASAFEEIDQLSHQDKLRLAQIVDAVFDLIPTPTPELELQSASLRSESLQYARNFDKKADDTENRTEADIDARRNCTKTMLSACALLNQDYRIAISHMTDNGLPNYPRFTFEDRLKLAWGVISACDQVQNGMGFVSLARPELIISFTNVMRGYEGPEALEGAYARAYENRKHYMHGDEVLKAVVHDALALPGHLQKDGKHDHLMTRGAQAMAQSYNPDLGMPRVWPARPAPSDVWLQEIVKNLPPSPHI